MKKETTDYIFILEERTKGTWIYDIFVSVLRNQLRTETVRDRNHNLGLTELGEQKSWTYYNTISTSKGRELTSKSNAVLWWPRAIPKIQAFIFSPGLVI